MYIDKEKIFYYMDLKGIKKQTDLLRKIGAELGYSGDELYKFPEREKTNFSKMINGKRKLKTDYIMPIEKILGLSLNKIINSSDYRLPSNKEDIPFLKGIKYYAYKDDVNLYVNELSKMTDTYGKSIIFNSDEFGRKFTDYIIDYNSVNAIKYLYDTYHIQLKFYNFLSTEENGKITTHFVNTIPLVKLVAETKDADLFFNIYDVYYMFSLMGDYCSKDCIYEQDEFIEVILENEHLFKSIFSYKEYTRCVSSHEKRKYNIDSVTINTINPIINGCLRVAIENIDQYKSQAIEIIKFAEKHNKEVIGRLLSQQQKYDINQLGGLYYEYQIFDLIVRCDLTCNDKEVNNLIEKVFKNKINYDMY